VTYFNELSSLFPNKLQIYECQDQMQQGAFDALFDKVNYIFLLSYPLEHKTQSDQLLANVKKGLENTFASISKVKGTNQLKRLVFVSTVATVAPSKLFANPSEIKSMKNEDDYNKVRIRNLGFMGKSDRRH